MCRLRQQAASVTRAQPESFFLLPDVFLRFL
nr:MAG TPA: hypothetical protein [Caudoviricetes sp.]